MVTRIKKDYGNINAMATTAVLSIKTSTASAVRDGHSGNQIGFLVFIFIYIYITHVHNRYICTWSRTYLHAFSLFKPAPDFALLDRPDVAKKKHRRLTSAAASHVNRTEGLSQPRPSANETALLHAPVRNSICSETTMLNDDRVDRGDIFFLAFPQVRLVFQRTLGMKKKALEENFSAICLPPFLPTTTARNRTPLPPT